MDRGNAAAARRHPILQPAPLIPTPHPPVRCPAVSLDLLEPSRHQASRYCGTAIVMGNSGGRKPGAARAPSCLDKLLSPGLRLQRPPALLRRLRGDEAAPSFLNGSVNDDDQGCTDACAIIP
jgi:hypothetical protein